jgi:SAM-dependent methyltransferase
MTFDVRAEAYDRFMGRWSALLAPAFIRFAGVRDGERVLDVGSGTGSLSRVLASSGEKISVIGVDPVADYVAFAREVVRGGRVGFKVGAVEALPFASETFDATLGLLILQDLTDPVTAVREMARVTRRNGTVASCKWDFREGLPMLSLFWQAARVVAPEAVMRQQARNPPPGGAGPRELAELWTGSGLSDIRTARLELAMEFISFDDYWQPFLGGATPTSTFAAALDTETGGAVASVLRDMVPDVRSDGSFVLPALAWAVAGTAGP